MLPFLRAGVFAQCLSKLSSELRVPVFSSGLSWGKLPFFQELRQKTSTPFDEVAGVKYARVVVEGTSFFVGPFKTSEVCTLDEELCEARESLPLWNDSFETIARIVIEHAVVSAKDITHNADALAQARLVLEFLHSVGHIQDVDRLLQSSAQFFVQKFRLSNAILKVFDKEARYFDWKTEVSRLVEQRLGAHLRSSRAAFTIQNIAKDFLLDGIKDREKLPKSVYVFPVLSGYALLYTDGVPELAGINDVLAELSALLERVTQYEKIQESAVTDPMTGLHNRGYLIASMDKLLSLLSANNQPVSVLLFDVDNFKRFNDTQGHPEGDRILKVIAEVMHNVAPKPSICCRYGGEEFIVVLPGAEQNAAKQVAEKLRGEIQNSCPLTVSIGAITCMNSSASRETLIREADRALYRAKDLGKNRVVQFVMVDRNLGVIDA